MFGNASLRWNNGRKRNVGNNHQATDDWGQSEPQAIKRDEGLKVETRSWLEALFATNDGSDRLID